MLASSVSDDDAERISDLLAELDNPELTNQERKAIQAELSEIVGNLEQGVEKDEADVETLAAVARSSLEAASNKELDSEDKMMDAVNELLGISEDNEVVAAVKAMDDAPEPEEE
ncbi:hypothetical protein [Pontibacterium sp.]|uniref:hypothetical protein n=1 Tax=Pontibacterium sp. TaxID=2036026 RepID=UPI003515029D